MPHPYCTAEELKLTISPQAYLAIFDDDNAGAPSQAAVDLLLSRASGRVDAHLRHIYPDASLPLADPIPNQAREAALEFATGMSFLRHKEYAARYGEKGRVEEFERAEKLCKDLANVLQRLVGVPALPEPSNVRGGVIQGNGVACDGIGQGMWRKGFGGFLALDSSLAQQMFDFIVDLSDVKRGCDEGQTQRDRSARLSVSTAAKEGLAEALLRRRYKDYTWRLTRTAHVVPADPSGAIASTIFWPMVYASRVEVNRGFAGDAYVKAERVAAREIELSFRELERILNR